MYELIPEIFIMAERKNRCLRENTFYKYISVNILKEDA